MHAFISKLSVDKNMYNGEMVLLYKYITLLYYKCNAFLINDNEFVQLNHIIVVFLEPVNRCNIQVCQNIELKRSGKI